uniref:Uncharacterized protein n=1 Tax=Anopheles coluzzii TaxID=1518534 RepID=A0A8W7PKC6_ANOCL
MSLWYPNKRASTVWSWHEVEESISITARQAWGGDGEETKEEEPVGMGNRFDDNRLTLRIHRGRGSTSAPLHESPHSNGSTHSTTTSIGSASPERLSRYSTRGKLVGHGGTVPHPTAHHEKIKISVSYPSTENVAQSCHAEAVGTLVRAPNVYDICHPLVMESPASSGGGLGPLQGHPLAPLPPLRSRLEPDSSRSLRRLNI